MLDVIHIPRGVGGVFVLFFASIRSVWGGEGVSQRDIFQHPPVWRDRSARYGRFQQIQFQHGEDLKEGGGRNTA